MCVLTGLRRHGQRFVRLSSWSQLCYASRVGLLQAAHKLLVLSLQRLDLLLEGHLDGLHRRGVLCDQRGLAQTHTGYRGNRRSLSPSLRKGSGCTHLVLAQAQGWILELLNRFLIKVTIFLPQLQQLERLDIPQGPVWTGRTGKTRSPSS